MQMQNGNEEDKPVEDVEAAVDELMSDFDLDEDEAKKVQRLENEGYDEEDAVSQATNS